MRRFWGRHARVTVRELFDMLADPDVWPCMREDPRDPAELGALVYYINPPGHG